MAKTAVQGSKGSLSHDGALLRTRHKKDQAAMVMDGMFTKRAHEISSWFASIDACGGKGNKQFFYCCFTPAGAASYTIFWGPLFTIHVR